MGQSVPTALHKGAACNPPLRQSASQGPGILASPDELVELLATAGHWPLGNYVVRMSSHAGCSFLLAAEGIGRFAWRMSNSRKRASPPPPGLSTCWLCRRHVSSPASSSVVVFTQVPCHLPPPGQCHSGLGPQTCRLPLAWLANALATEPVRSGLTDG